MINTMLIKMNIAIYKVDVERILGFVRMYQIQRNDL